MSNTSANRHAALDNIDLQLRPGELVAVMGPSAAGNLFGKAVSNALEADLCERFLGGLSALLAGYAPQPTGTLLRGCERVIRAQPQRTTTEILQSRTVG